MCGRLPVGKSFVHDGRLGRWRPCVRPVRAAHMTLAIMPSADHVPINSPHSTMLGGYWVVLRWRWTTGAMGRLGEQTARNAEPVDPVIIYAASATGPLRWVLYRLALAIGRTFG